MPMETKPLILACSPRPGGNTDWAADLVAEAFSTRAVRLREHPVSACTGCGACAKAARRAPSLTPENGVPYLGCPLSLRDASAPLIAGLLRTPFIFVAAPIFFYHLPAGFKALIDRLQPFWALREAGDARVAALPGRRAGVLLCAARPQGEKLFAGSLLTLRLALGLLKVDLPDPLLLRDLDAPGDLAGNPGALESVRAYAATCLQQSRFEIGA